MPPGFPDSCDLSEIPPPMEWVRKKAKTGDSIHYAVPKEGSPLTLPGRMILRDLALDDHSDRVADPLPLGSV